MFEGHYLLAFSTCFISIGLRSVQQLNVVHKKYAWIVPTSLLMASCEVWVIANIATQGWGWLVLWVGLGSGLGSLTATYLHSKLNKGKI